MLVFNSLGSNYSFKFALQAFAQLFVVADKSKALEKKLAEIFPEPGEVRLFYKGRDAIEYTLRALNVGTGDEVITQAFCCSSIEEAVNRVGATVRYADLKPGKLYPSVETLEVARKKATKAKAVILQHLFGYSAETELIKKWSEKNQLLLIDDLAQAYGAKNSENDLLGSAADAVIFSFGRDKILDAVSGGASIIRKPIKKIDYEAGVSFFTIIKDLFYPLLTWKIRRTYSLQLGKVIHLLAKKTGLMTNPILSVVKEMSALPKQYPALILERFNLVDEDLLRRKEIANIYYHGLYGLKGIKIIPDEKEINLGVNLRFVIAVDQPQSLISFLAKENIFISDRWYRQPVDCGEFKCPTSYLHEQCPNAEKMAREIVNLPTHREISHQVAIRIVAAIEKWSQQL